MAHVTINLTHKLIEGDLSDIGNNRLIHNPPASYSLLLVVLNVRKTNYNGALYIIELWLHTLCNMQKTCLRNQPQVEDSWMNSCFNVKS